MAEGILRVEDIEKTDKTIDVNKLKKNICGNRRYSEKSKENIIISAGRYGIVCEARDKRNNKLFAIKTIPLRESFFEKFSKEIDVLVKLRENKFIVKLENTWMEDNYIKPNVDLNFK